MTDEDPIEKTYQSIVIRIEYDLSGSYEGLQFMSLPSTKDDGMIGYFQLLYSDSSSCNRIWMPCFDSHDQRCLWDLQFSISTTSIDPSLLDKLHAVSTGVLFRQFSTEDRKIFHFKLDSMMAAPLVSFAVGLFESVKIPLAPFAYAFCPIGMASKLNLAVEFFSKAFGFYNWYLSTLFPFASYFLVFAKQTPVDAYTGANLSILSANLLHDNNIIDQAYETRRILAECLCAQYFGVKIRADRREDEWLIEGFQKYLSALLLRVFHGKNDYRYTLKVDVERAFELEPGMAPLHSTRIGHDVKTREWFSLKSRIVLCLLERKLEKSGLQRVFMHLWSEACEGRLSSGGVLTTRHLLKSVKKMTGKDIRSFADQWIFGSGAPLFTCSFLYNRKKSSIDVDLKQSTPGQPSKKWSGSLLIRVHEQEGVFDHSVHIDDFTHRIELPYHTKIRKARKKRQAMSSIGPKDDDSSADEEDHMDQEQASQGPKAGEEEVEEDFTSATSPISWIRLDPDMDWFCLTDVHQPDFMWIEQLENDRDVAAQHEATQKLSRHASEAAIECYEKAVLNWKYFYKIRIDAVFGLAACATEQLNWLGMSKLLGIFGRRFGLERAGGLHPIPKANNFDNLSNYFVQKAIPEALATIRTEEGAVPDVVIRFITDVLRFNDNSFNSMSDNFYLAQTVRVLGSALQARSPGLPQEDYRRAVEEIERFAMIEQMIPFFRNTVMCAVVDAKSRLPSTVASELAPYLEAGNFVDVRVAAFIGILRCDKLANLEDALGFLRNASDSRRFLFGCVRSMEREFAARLAETPHASAAIWRFLSTLPDANLSGLLLDLAESAFVGAAEDRLVEEAPEALASTLPSAHIAPIRLNMQVHELGSSGDEADGDGAGFAEEADWIAELAGADGSTPRTSKSHPIPRLKIKPLTILHHQTINHEEEQRQLEANPLMRALQEIWDNYDSFPFRYPVDPSVPGYYTIIKYPMDLSTIRDRVKGYGRAEDLARDLRLMFDNCFTFNQPGSLIYDQALRLRQSAYKTLKRAFPDQAKAIKRHLTASEPIVILPEAQQPAPVPKLKLSVPAPTISIPKVIVKVPPPAVATPPPPPAVPVLSDKEKMAQIMERLKGHQHAYWFAQPIDPIALGIPTYFEIITEPMDFATITDRLTTDHYSGHPEAFKHDVELVFGNAKLFNPANTMVHQHAVAIEKLFHRLWSKAFPSPATPRRKQHPESDDVVSVMTSSPVQPLKIKLNLAAATQQVSGWESSARSILDQVRQHEYAVPFLVPVDPVALGCPTYYDEISHPMDLQTMGRKLVSHQYGSSDAFVHDFKLIIKNCIQFNGRKSEIAQIGLSLQTFFLSLVDEFGL